MSAPNDGREDIGHGVWIRRYGWHPDRVLNPQHIGVPDVDWAGIIVGHRHADGTECQGAVSFAGTGLPNWRDRQPRWDVLSWEPLTLSPSILRRDCPEQLHGFVREGRWVPA